ncbi:hypothetical protein FKP32DRAFT_650059 [Trametes sanguinea]|nr:hypothetical protein FKP32DRAFT_650059 [Trametes sanguinea]
MHECLLLPDILQRILDFVEVEVPDRFYAGHCSSYWKNGTLARLARTCRAFHQPSLDVLWRHQFTLGPLVKTLPEDAWEEDQRRRRSPYIGEPDTIIHDLTITRPLLSSDWSRFDYYAHRIKSLGYFDVEFADEEGGLWSYPNRLVCEHPVDWMTVQRLAMHRRHRWLLPNLVRLRWTIHDHTYTEFLPLFLGPCLRTLAIAIGIENCRQYQPDIFASVLEAIPASCPSLTELEIYPRQDPFVLLATDEILSVACDRLEGFHICTIPWGDAEDVDELSRMPRLRKVCLSMDEWTVALLPSLWGATAYPFSAVSILSVDVPHLRVCTSFLRLLRPCRLFSIITRINHRPKAQDVYDFYDTLRSKCSQETLHVCHVIQEELHRCKSSDVCPEDGTVLSDPEHRVTMAELTPALHFPHLRHFTLGAPLLGYFVDEDYIRMADAWPGIISLSIMDGWGAILRSPATWMGVGYMVTRCPQMLQIEVPFDTTSTNVDELLHLPDFRPNHSLRFFNVLDSPLPDNVEHFARSLVTIAPRVVGVFAAGYEKDPDGP